MTAAPLRVAVVGAGPSGIYTAAALTEQDRVPVDVQLIDRLPTPFGLVRYGVAPDHVTIRDVRSTMQSLLEDDRIRFIGNVAVGADISLSELRSCVDAVVYTYGAALDRELGIPGEQLQGSLSAKDVVSWYCGHPDADGKRVEPALERTDAAVVVGVGNVALDVARVLAKGAEALEWTDMPQHVLDALRRTDVRDIHIVGRRSPARAAFTSKELRELGALDDVDVVVAPQALELDEVEAAVAAGNKVVSRNIALLSQWSQRQAAGHPKRIHFHFWSRPAEVTGTAAVDGVLLEETEPDGRGGVQPSGRFRRIDAQLVVRAVGYRSVPLADLPFDHANGIVINAGGRVLRNGAPSPGEYVAGWAKRGPSGVIGTNKMDALETVDALLEDAPSLLKPPTVGETNLVALLRARGLDAPDLDAWRRIDAAELELGSRRGRSRTTIHTRELLLKAGRDPSSAVEEISALP
jgi:ferredoxin--NADP+ reductase